MGLKLSVHALKDTIFGQMQNNRCNKIYLPFLDLSRDIINQIPPPPSFN